MACGKCKCFPYQTGLIIRDIKFKGLGYISHVFLSQKWFEENCRQTIKIISEVIILRNAQL
jgi:hypothetical protein